MADNWTPPSDAEVVDWTPPSDAQTTDGPVKKKVATTPSESLSQDGAKVLSDVSEQFRKAGTQGEKPLSESGIKNEILKVVPQKDITDETTLDARGNKRNTRNLTYKLIPLEDEQKAIQVDESKKPTTLQDAYKSKISDIYKLAEEHKSLSSDYAKNYTIAEVASLDPNVVRLNNLMLQRDNAMQNNEGQKVADLSSEIESLKNAPVDTPTDIQQIVAQSNAQNQGAPQDTPDFRSGFKPKTINEKLKSIGVTPVKTVGELVDVRSIAQNMMGDLKKPIESAKYDLDEYKERDNIGVNGLDENGVKVREGLTGAIPAFIDGFVNTSKSMLQGLEYFDATLKGDDTKKIELAKQRWVEENILHPTENKGAIANASNMLGGVAPYALGGAVLGEAEVVPRMIMDATGMGLSDVGNGYYEGFAKMKDEGKSDEEANDYATKKMAYEGATGAMLGAGLPHISNGSSKIFGVAKDENTVRKFLADGFGMTTAFTGRKLLGNAYEKYGLGNENLKLSEGLQETADGALMLHGLMHVLPKAPKAIKDIYDVTIARQFPNIEKRFARGVEKGEITQQQADAITVPLRQKYVIYNAMPEGLTAEQMVSIKPETEQILELSKKEPSAVENPDITKDRIAQLQKQVAEKLGTPLTEKEMKSYEKLQEIKGDKEDKLTPSEKLELNHYEKRIKTAEDNDVKLAEEKKVAEAETPTNVGVEAGSVGVGGDVGVLKDGNGNVMGKGESKIIEVSPDGKQVKVDNVNGWHPIELFEVDRVKSTSNKLENLSEKDFDKLTPSQKVSLYKEHGITKEDGSPITEKDIENSPLQYSYDFMASSESGKWNSANSELESLVKDHRKAYSLYKMLIGDNFAGDNNTFKDIVDYINNKTDANIEYTDRMRRADETMSAEERQAAVDSYNKSAEGKTEDKVQKEKDILEEHGLADETEYSPHELVEKFPLKGVQKVIWDIIKPIVEKLGIKVKFSSSRITEGFDGSNNPMNGEILLRPSTLKNGRLGEVLVHEVVHSLTTKIISRVNSGVETGLTGKQVAAVKGLNKLYKSIEADNNLQNKYPVKDIFEFIAHLTNDSFVKELESKDRNFIQKVVDYISDILGLSNANELAKKYLKDIIHDGTFLEKEGITVVSSDYAANVKGAEGLTPKQRLLEAIKNNSKTTAEKYHDLKSKGKENDFTKAVEQSLKETTKAETPTETIQEKGIEEAGSVGGGRDKSDADIEKRMAELEGAKIGTPELAEFNALEKEMEKRERATVFNVPLEKVNDAVDALTKKEKEQPNGFGAFIEKRDARETKEVANRYLDAKKLTDDELKQDFKDAVLGNPDTWYADGLKLRESMKEATKRGIETKDLVAEVEKQYVKDGYTEADARRTVANQLKPIFKEASTEATIEPVNTSNEEGVSGLGGDVESNWNYEGEGDAFASNKDSRDGKSAYVIRILDKNGRGNSYNRAKQRGELDTESPLTYEGDKESVSAIDGNGNTVGVIKLQTDGGVEHIVVAPEFSRKGVASELIKQIEQKGAKVQPEKSKQISPDAAKLFNELKSLKETPKAEPIVAEKPVVENKEVPKSETKVDFDGNEIGSKSYQENKPTQLVGREREKVVADGTKIKGTYKVVSADDVIASHNEETFSKERGFPTKDGKTVNDRDYEKDNIAQQEVIRIANELDQRAVAQTPIVTKEGVVIDGNNRTMSRKLAAKQGTDKAYLDALQSEADMYGIDPNEISKIKNPMLVFEPTEDLPYTTETLKRFNVTEKKEKSTIEKAVEISKTISDKVRSIMNSIYDNADRPSDITSDPKAMADIRKTLIDAKIWQPNEIAKYINAETGTATKSGVEFLETLLMGSSLDENTIRMLNAEGMGNARNMVLKSIVPLTKNSTMGENSLTPNIAKGIELLNQAKNAKSNVLSMINQLSIFEQAKYSAEDLALATLLESGGLKKFLNEYNSKVGTNGLFGEITKSGEIDEFLRNEIKNYEQIRSNLRINEPIAEAELPKGDGVVKQENDNGIKEEAKPKGEPDEKPKSEGSGEGGKSDTTTESKGKQPDKTAGQGEITGKDKIARGLDALSDILGGKLKAFSDAEKPKVVNALRDIAEGLIEEGKATIDNVVEKLYEYVKDKMSKEDYNSIKNDVKKSFESKSETNEKVKEETKITGITKAVQEEEWKALGIDSDFANQLSRDWNGTVLKEANERIKANPHIASILAKELNDKPRPTTDTENAILLIEKRRLQNLFDEHYNDKSETDNSIALLAIQDKLVENMNAIEGAGTSLGRGLNSLKMAMAKDYSLATMLAKKRLANGNKPLSPEVEKQITDLHQKITDLQKKFDDYVEKKKSESEENNAQGGVDRARKDVRRTNRNLSKEKLKAERDVIVSSIKDKVASLLESATEKTGGKLNAMESRVDNKELLASLSTEISNLVKNLVEDKVLDLVDIVDNIHDELKGVIPDLSKREVRDAISGYGKEPKKQTKSEMQSEIDRLKKEAKQLSKQEDIASGKIDEPKLKALKTRTENRIKELKDKIDRGDFSKAEKKIYELDDTALRLKAELDREKAKFSKGLQADALAKRDWSEKGQDALAQWSRAIKLSGIVTLGKLTAAATERVAITPAEEAVGGVIGKLFPKLSQKAEREGGINAKIEAQALSRGFMKGMEDSWKILTTGESNLDVSYGKQDNLPHSVLDFFGHLHGALKAVPKRIEFERSFAKRMESQANKGIDVSNPLVQTKTAIQAYKDSKRAIFMQDNMVASAWTNFIKTLERKDKNTGESYKAIATIGKTLLPFVKIPTNIVGETLTYAGGSVSGSVKLAKALTKGIENVSPEEADIVLRHLKKGSLGLGMLALGFMNPQSIGGYYQKGEKRRDDEVGAGEVELFGEKIPKFLVHNPLLECLQIGSTIRRVSDSYTKKKPNGALTSVMAGLLGIADEVPFIKTGELLKGAMESEHEANYFIGSYLKGMIDPALLQDIARFTDKDEEGKVKKRQTDTVLEHIESGLPFLRQQLEEKETKNRNPTTPEYDKSGNLIKEGRTR